MVIQHNKISAYGNQMFQISNKRSDKSTEKLASGYRINRAADNAAGLAISEKMRGQIRGLKRADKNIAEGISYIKTAEGALDEATSMIHRMRELTVQALNDTNTKEDKEQIQLEINQLQQEIQRISRQTEYNTMDIFDKHEPTYSSLPGSREWSIDQIHKVDEPDNTLEIELAKGYEPSNITVTVPKGTYTSYELIETIDGLLEGKAPAGTSLMIEYYGDSVCNLNFEGGIGIEKVKGGLSYLFFDSYGGSSVGNLIGTTQFVDAYPLDVTTGMNDELTFYVDKLDGSSLEKISITLDAGNYTRQQMIDELNQKLQDAGHPEVKATSYGSNNIELSAGASLITGLKGNMFQIDDADSKAYDSVFYDNTKYGKIINSCGTVTGAAYYNSSVTDKIHINSSNNKLRFKLESEADYTEIMIPDGDYTIRDIVTKLNELLGADSSKWKFSYENKWLSGSKVPTSAYYDCLKLTSLTGGMDSIIKFDESQNAYQSLFTTTNVSMTETASITSGSDAYILGAKTLTGAISLNNAGETISLSAGGTSAVLTLSKANYSNLSELISDINTQIGNSALNGKIKAEISSNRIRIVTVDNSIASVQFSGNGGTARQELFVGESISYRYYSGTAVGEEKKEQGSTMVQKSPATLTLDYAMKADHITVDSSNQVFKLTVDGSLKTITLSAGTYTRSGLINEINAQFRKNGIGVTAELASGGKLKFTTTSVGDGASLSISTSTSGNTAMRVFMEPLVYTSSYSISSLQAAKITGKTTVENGYVINSSNKDLTFRYTDENGSKDISLVLTEKTYTNAAELVTELQNKINSSSLGAGKITVSVDSSNRIVLATTGTGSKYQLSNFSGGFYQNVLCKKTIDTKINSTTVTNGTTRLDSAFVVGRADLRNNTVEIKKDVNDVLTLDFTYSDANGTKQTITLETKFLPGVYTGSEIARLLTDGTNADDGMDGLNECLKKNGITDFKIKAEIGGQKTEVVGANDANALSFTLEWNKTQTPAEGIYVLDGVSGSAAYSVFYKTSGLPIPASITGNKDISSGVTITDKNNTFGFSIDGTDYDFTLPEGTYTAEEWIEMFNERIAAGDDNGNVPKVEAVLENGHLKIQYQTFGEHEITNIRGTAKQDLFFDMIERIGRSTMRLQIGANGGQELALNKIALSNSLLKIDTLIVTEHSYANFALKHLDYALNYINTKRSDYGAKQNRLEAAEKMTEVFDENLQTSESKIRDTDMASELMNRVRHNIVSQAAQAMIAQANQINGQGILRLLL